MTTPVTGTLSIARVLAMITAVVTAVGAVLADFAIPGGAAQHMSNDAWPPHAKFHDAQYIVMSVLLAGVSLALLMRRAGGSTSRLRTACAILATPWLGLLGATLFPGAAVQDPEFHNPAILGLHPQVLLAVILLAVLLVAVALTVRAEPQRRHR